MAAKQVIVRIINKFFDSSPNDGSQKRYCLRGENPQSDFLRMKTHNLILVVELGESNVCLFFSLFETLNIFSLGDTTYLNSFILM
jgi:hypothetical protein